MKYLPVIILFLVIFVGFFLRFYQLGSVPVGFHRDEAYLGYNAYSLLKTASDMSGNFLPVHLQTFLFSPAGYSYASIPFIFLFGLNEFAVRFASAFFGSFTILLIYFLVKELFGNRETTPNSARNYTEVLALLSTFFLAISPWHINLSRVATENVLVVFFIILGVLFHLKWAKEKNYWLLFLSFLSFGVTLLLYQAPRAFLPFFIPLLYTLYHPKPFRKNILFPGILFVLVIIVPTMFVLTSTELTQRIRMLSVFQHPETQLMLDEQIRKDEGNNTTITRFFHNKAVNYPVTFFDNYFRHFSYDFLFLDKGYPDRYRVPQMGLLYFFELPLLLFGIWKLLTSDKKLAFFLIGWAALAPLGSALTFDDVPNLQRTLTMLPPIAIISAYGFLQIWLLLQKIKFGRLGQGVLIIVMVYGFLYYLHQYYVHQINYRPWYRQEGYKELVLQVNELQSNYERIVVTDKESAPSIFFVFYNQYDPKVMQDLLRNIPTEIQGSTSLGIIEFPKSSCPLDEVLLKTIQKDPKLLQQEKDTLYINGTGCEKPEKGVKVISEIKRSDETVVFTLLEVTE